MTKAFMKEARGKEEKEPSLPLTEDLLSAWGGAGHFYIICTIPGVGGRGRLLSFH